MASTLSTDGERGLKPGAGPSRTTSHLPVTILRLLTFAATLSAFITMVTNNQKKTINVNALLSIQKWSKFRYSQAFVWFCVANCVAFIYALLAALVGAISKSPIITKHLVILDLLVATIIMSGASAATAVAYIGKHGLEEAEWFEICSLFERFCHHIAGALIASFLGWLFLMIATLLALRRRI